MKEWTVSLGGKDYPARELTTDNMEQILALQSVVLQHLENKEFLQPLTREEFEDSLKHRLMVGVFAGEELIAFRTLAIPVMDEHHLGYDIGLSESELGDVVYQEITNVHPEYRGYGLQRKLADLVMELLQDSPYIYICATVAPFNFASLKDKLSQGMVIKALKRKYDNMLRYIFCKRLDGNDYIVFGESQMNIKMSDIEEQQKLLKAGWVGTNILQKEEEWYVVYKETI
ncbi:MULTISPECIES: GNAT family N-acetyltransferase [unclassified Psychrobacillus]|uniref:GNAT family N-acetyltransferase n=1 Tax=unclassified Psychrobacillus TaxID=2636677 RepID=UPI00146A3CC7|nr:MULTISPECIES: GNAT family N-acetyltransferase [unclassified Psychrobacillus]MCM3358290.1 GNAT family N-acetyltransferase [Psychrobacillus sp. MER TA 171]NME05538.1 GNAT family N-acetyltransferase [Psychrobacillus sp. BL-248-WT-3]